MQDGSYKITITRWKLKDKNYKMEVTRYKRFSTKLKELSQEGFYQVSKVNLKLKFKAHNLSKYPQKWRILLFALVKIKLALFCIICGTSEYLWVKICVLCFKWVLFGTIRYFFGTNLHFMIICCGMSSFM